MKEIGWVRAWVVDPKKVPANPELLRLPPFSRDLTLPDDVPVGIVLLSGERERYIWLRENWHHLTRNPDGTVTHANWPKRPMAQADLIDFCMYCERRNAVIRANKERKGKL